MGMSKAMMMEKNVIARSKQMLADDPVLCLTRYGNVMASRLGHSCSATRSIWGKLLAVTNPNMTCSMMTLSDAVDLVLYAFEHGEQGDLFVQKVPVMTIETLAQTILEMKHLTSACCQTIGTRHGEKLFEVLVTSEEMLRAEDLPGFFRIHADSRDLNYDNYFSKGNAELSQIEPYTSHNTQRLDLDAMKRLLQKLKLFGGNC